MSDIYKDHFESAVFFLNEAASNAASADGVSPGKWKLATLHVVVGLEHLFKAKLAAIHPAFVRENLDAKKDKTVSIQTAIDRLQDRDIGSVVFAEVDQKRLRNAIKLRNEIAHAAAPSNPSAVSAKFFETFAFCHSFCWSGFKEKLDSHLEPEVRLALKNLVQLEVERKRRARSEIKDSDELWDCAECGHDFYVVRDGQFECMYCQNREPIQECMKCRIVVPEHRLYETAELFEYEFIGGHAELVDNYEIEDGKVCYSCFFELEKKRDSKVAEEQLYEAESAYYNYMLEAIERDPF